MSLLVSFSHLYGLHAGARRAAWISWRNRWHTRSARGQMLTHKHTLSPAWDVLGPAFLTHTHQTLPRVPTAAPRMSSFHSCLDCSFDVMCWKSSLAVLPPCSFNSPASTQSVRRRQVLSWREETLQILQHRRECLHLFVSLFYSVSSIFRRKYTSDLEFKLCSWWVLGFGLWCNSDSCSVEAIWPKVILSQQELNLLFAAFCFYSCRPCYLRSGFIRSSITPTSHVSFLKSRNDENKNAQALIWYSPSNPGFILLFVIS